MRNIQLTDEMIGDRKVEPRKRPTLDVFGKPYEEHSPAKYNVRNIGNEEFVFVPSDKDSEDIEFVRPSAISVGSFKFSSDAAPIASDVPPSFDASDETFPRKRK